MRPLATCLCVVVTVGCFGATVRAEQPSPGCLGAAGALGPVGCAENWVIMAGCPEAVSVAGEGCVFDMDGTDQLVLENDAEMIDGNRWITQWNLLHDGLESTWYEEAGYPVSQSVAVKASATPLRSASHAQVEAVSVASPEWSAMLGSLMPIEQSIQAMHAHVAGRVAQVRGEVHRALGYALLHGLLDVRSEGQAASIVPAVADPEMEPPLDSLTAAWIAAVRDTDPAESTDDPSHVVSACEQPGCGGIALPRPVDAPQPQRAIR